MSKSVKGMISALLGLIFFCATVPFQFDIYIPSFHSAVSVVLLLISSALFSIMLYRIIAGNAVNKETGSYLYFLIISGIPHCIYSVMFWTSWVCLGLISAFLLATAILMLRGKKKK